MRLMPFTLIVPATAMIENLSHTVDIPREKSSSPLRCRRRSTPATSPPNAQPTQTPPKEPTP